ncbi:unnamed protein product [Rhodiola kirilowii]
MDGSIQNSKGVRGRACQLIQLKRGNLQSQWAKTQALSWSPLDPENTSITLHDLTD